MQLIFEWGITLKVKIKNKNKVSPFNEKLFNLKNIDDCVFPQSELAVLH